MVLADEIVLNMTDSRRSAVFAGHRQLAASCGHRRARRRLSETAFSSAACWALPGGAYAAANSWVDGLVAHRRSADFHCRDWGPWADVERAQFFKDLGVEMIKRRAGRRHAGGTHRRSRAHRCVQPRRGSGSNRSPARRGLMFMATLTRRPAKVGQRRGGGAIRAQLGASTLTERPDHLASRSPTRSVRCCAQAIYRSPPTAGNPQDSTLMGLGAQSAGSRIWASLPVALCGHTRRSAISRPPCADEWTTRHYAAAQGFDTGRTVRRGDGFARRSG